MKEILDPINDLLKNSKESIVNKGLKSLMLYRVKNLKLKKILLKTRTKLEQVEAKLDLLIAEKK